MFSRNELLRNVFFTGIHSRFVNEPFYLFLPNFGVKNANTRTMYALNTIFNAFFRVSDGNLYSFFTSTRTWVLRFDKNAPFPLRI